MSDSTSEVRCAAMLMLFDAYSAKCAEVEALRKALEQIANGDPSRVYSPIGALHAAGMVTQWEQDAAIARAALSAADQPAAVRDPARCYACGWPLADSPERGCVPGDCSYRPSPQSPDYEGWRKRMDEMRAADKPDAVSAPALYCEHCGAPRGAADHVCLVDVRRKE